MMVTGKLIRQMEHAKENHVWWATEQRKRRSQGRKPVRCVGCESFHRKWVRIYDEVIAALKDLEMLTCSNV